MPERETIQAWLETAAAQIRWRRARPVLTRELAHHLEDQRDAFAAEGRENAEALAVEEMGDPVSVGAELDRIHRPDPQWGPLALSLILAAAPMAAVFLRGQRLAAALHPELDPLGGGYTALTIRQALSSARWLGEGDWTGAASPDPSPLVANCGSDAFLTTLICKLGWLPFLAVVLPFALLAAWLLRRRARHQSQLGRAVVLAATVVLCLQALCSAAWSLGFTLLGASFPLVVGNWSTVMNLGLIGLALSVFREERIARDAPCSVLPRWRVRISIQRVS